MRIYFGFFVVFLALLVVLGTLFAMIRIVLSRLTLKRKALWLLFLLLSGPVGAVLWFAVGAPSPSSPSTSPS